LRVKRICLDGELYIICHNPEREEEDARRQMEILAALGAQLVQGELAGLAKRRGYGQYLKVCDGGRAEDKLAKGEARCPL